MTTPTTEDLGDPKVPQPGDPTEITLTVDARVLQAVVLALNEMAAKVSRRALDSIEEQVDAAVLATRRRLRDERKRADAERKAAAEEKREKKQARRAARLARTNGGSSAEARPAK